MFCTCYAVRACTWCLTYFGQSSLASFSLQFFTIFTFFYWWRCVLLIFWVNTAPQANISKTIWVVIYVGEGGREKEEEGGWRQHATKKHKQACSDQSCLLSYHSPVMKASQPCRVFFWLHKCVWVCAQKHTHVCLCVSLLVSKKHK